MKALSLVSLALVACFALSACETAQEKSAKSVQTALNALGQGNWTYVKADTRIKNFSVFLGPDGKYHAIDTSKYVAGTDVTEYLKTATIYDDLAKSVDTYQDWEVVHTTSFDSNSCPNSNHDADFNCWNETDAQGNHYYEVDESDYGWVTVHEDIYTDAGSGLVFDIGASGSKDLEAVAGSVASTNTAAIKKQLVATYGLSQDRAADLASLAQSWQSIANSREMTAKDLSEFQVKAFGTDLSAISTAKVKADKGDAKDYNTLLQKAAQMNEISPEQAKSILNSFM